MTFKLCFQPDVLQESIYVNNEVPCEECAHELLTLSLSSSSSLV